MKQINKTIVSYVLPSVASLLVTFLYIAVDSIFVGQGVGADALAAVNLALPYAALITSLANLVGMGAAAVAAVRLGRGDRSGAGDAASAGILVSIIIGCIVCAFGMYAPDSIAFASGARTRLLNPTSEYIFYYSAFAMFAVMSICLSTLVRNDGRPGLAFWGMIAGAGANIFLDWLFIFPFQMGIMGAAVASGIGQILSMAILSSHFIFSKKSLRLRLFVPSRQLWSKIFLRGTPEFITQISQPMTILCFNYVVMREFGEMGVASYAIICNLTSLMFAVVIGVACGMQPLFGRSFGQKDGITLKYFYKAGSIINFVASAGIYLGLLAAGQGVTSLFNSDVELSLFAARSLGLYGIAFIIASINITTTAFFLSTKRTVQAMLVAGLRGCGLNIVFIFLLPALFGGQAAWTALIVSESLVAVLVFALMRKVKTHRNSDSVILLRRPVPEERQADEVA